MNRHSPIAWLSLLIVLVSVLAGCGRDHDGESGESNADSAAVSDTTSDKDQDQTDEEDDDPVPVNVAVLGRGPHRVRHPGLGHTGSRDRGRCGRRSGRRVQKIHVEEGDRVRAGQLLLRLQDEEQRSIVAKTESRLAKAEREFTRQKSLREQDLSSDQTLIDAEYEYDQQKIALEDAARALSYTAGARPHSGGSSPRAWSMWAIRCRSVRTSFTSSTSNRWWLGSTFPRSTSSSFTPDSCARVTARAINDEPYEATVLRDLSGGGSPDGNDQGDAGGWGDSPDSGPGSSPMWGW